MSAKDRLSLGLVGCGHWGRHILRDLIALDCDVHVVARSAASMGNAQAGGCTSVVSRIEDLPIIEGAVIATHTNVHAECIQQLSPRKIPMFVEKPLTASVEQAESLQQYSHLLFVMDKWRYHPGVVELGKLARNGMLGDVESVHCTRWGWKSHARDIHAVWYLAPHDLAITLEILGKLPEVQFARFQYYDDSPSGGIAILGSYPWVEINVSERRETRLRQVRVHGTRGIGILQDSYSGEIEFYRFPEQDAGREPVPERIPVSKEMPLLLELKAFVDYIRGGPAPKSNFHDSIATVYALQEIHTRALARA